MPARMQAAEASSGQDVKCQAISLIFLMQWLLDGVDVGLKNNTDSGEFLPSFFFFGLKHWHSLTRVGNKQKPHRILGWAFIAPPPPFLVYQLRQKNAKSVPTDACNPDTCFLFHLAQGRTVITTTKVESLKVPNNWYPEISKTKTKQSMWDRKQRCIF